jgi:hypothetical protein
MSTRSIEECQDFAELWLAGDKEPVIDEMGEPLDRFIADYRPGGPYGRAAEKQTLKLVDKIKTADAVKKGA